ncbi:MAG: ArsR family transcriptional regulator [Bacteroidetes bacterium]|nr:MAG: ArsR family transcriptional regulator [Bacteroidota bacterium]
MLEALITSKTRIKLLLKFFLNSKNTGYLRSLEPEFGESTNSIRLELNRFEEAGLLHSVFQNKKKIFSTNINHPLFPELQNLLRKHIGLDEIIERVIKQLGKLEQVYLVGDLAKGNDSDTIDLWFVGEELDEAYLETLIEKAKKFIKRKLSYKVINREELNKRKSSKDKNEILLLWEA